MGLRKLLMVTLFAAGSIPVMAAEPWTEMYQERLTQAQQGSADAQFELGAMYQNGRGVTADLAQAMQWYRKAADQGHSRAAQALARLEGNVQRLDKTRSQAESGDVEAQFTLGTMYLTGTGTAADLKLAEQWLRRAAEKDYTKAQFKLGHLYYVELADDGNMRDAYKWFSKAAASNYPAAHYYLGDMYATGSGVTRDYTKARNWYEKARAAGFAPALQAIKELDERLAQQAAETPTQPAAAVSTANPEIEPTPSLDPLKRLLQGHWMNGKRPVQFLPSKVSECNSSNNSLVCYSRELARKDLPQVHYKVKSIIRTADNSDFKIVYRELILQDITDYGTGSDAELLQETGIPPGWQEPHSLHCKFTGSQQLSCAMDNGTIVEFIDG